MMQGFSISQASNNAISSFISGHLLCVLVLPVVLKTKAVVVVGIVVVVIQGVMILVIFPFSPQIAVMQVPSPSCVLYTISPYV